MRQVGWEKRSASGTGKAEAPGGEHQAVLLLETGEAAMTMTEANIINQSQGSMSRRRTIA